MIITYPECQIEITSEEVITLIDHFKIEVTCDIDPSIDRDAINNTDDEMPEPKPYPNPDETISWPRLKRRTKNPTNQHRQSVKS